MSCSASRWFCELLEARLFALSISNRRATVLEDSDDGPPAYFPMLLIPCRYNAAQLVDRPWNLNPIWAVKQGATLNDRR